MIPIQNLRRLRKLRLRDVPDPVRPIAQYHHLLGSHDPATCRFLPQVVAKALGLHQRRHIAQAVRADLQLLRALALSSADGLEAAADLQLTPASLMQMGQHTIHSDIQPLGAGRGCNWQVVSRGRLDDGLCLMGNQSGAKLFGGITHRVRAEVNEREALKHRGSVGEGILGCPEQGHEFVETSTAAAGAHLELGVQGMLAMATGATEIVGPFNGDGAEDGGDLGGTLALVGGELATGAQHGGRRQERDGEGRKAGHQCGAELFERRRTCSSTSASVRGWCIQVERVRVMVAMRSHMVVTSCSVREASVLGSMATSSGCATNRVSAAAIVAHR